MSLHMTCHHCSLGGESCYLKLSKSPKPKFHYEHRKVGGQTVLWCTGVTPKPREIKDPSRESCHEWRDAAERSKDEVLVLVQRGLYSY